jgi:hypothetical protein
MQDLDVMVKAVSDECTGLFKNILDGFKHTYRASMKPGSSSNQLPNVSHIYNTRAWTDTEWECVQGLCTQVGLYSQKIIRQTYTAIGSATPSL